MWVPKETVKGWFWEDIIGLIDRMEVNPALAFVAVPRLHDIEWNAIALNDCFPTSTRLGCCLVLTDRRRWLLNGLMVPKRGLPVQKRMVLFTVKRLLRVICRSNLAKRFSYSIWRVWMRRRTSLGFYSLRQRTRC